MAMQDRELDAVVFGATGDTGVLACCWLYFNGQKLGIHSWAPAARNLEKVKTDVLDRFAKSSGPGEFGVENSQTIKADSGDRESLLQMCRKARIVIACAGPYSMFGEAVIQACCEVGTHYVDITGEYFWVAEMESKYGKQALEKQVSIVSLAGYDSVPPDLTTFLAASALKEQGEAIRRYDCFFGLDAGMAAPSGTIETGIVMIQDIKAAVCGCCCCGFGYVKRPASLPDTEVGVPLNSAGPAANYVPESERSNLGSNTCWNSCPSWSPLGKQFSILHFMAPVNINVVHRTAAAEGYGGLMYRERMSMGSSCFPTLWGFLTTLFTLLFLIILGIFLLLPGAERCLRCVVRPSATKLVRDKMFAGCTPTGMTSVRGYGDSKSGKAKVEIAFDSPFDGGLGFTTLSACTVAGLIVQKSKGGEKANPGFQTAVTCVGGNALLEGLKNTGHVNVNVTVTKF